MASVGMTCTYYSPSGGPFAAIVVGPTPPSSTHTLDLTVFYDGGSLESVSGVPPKGKDATPPYWEPVHEKSFMEKIISPAPAPTPVAALTPMAAPKPPKPKHR